VEKRTKFVTKTRMEDKIVKIARQRMVPETYMQETAAMKEEVTKHRAWRMVPKEVLMPTPHAYR